MIVFILLDITTHTHTGLVMVLILLTKIEDVLGIKIVAVQHTGLESIGVKNV